MKLFKNTPLIPSIRPKCGADKKGFLNDVYTKGTREKKLQLDAPQSGRSMIEMLGVLAIIGVLSIGGITGYSKAMFKYKFNKTIEIFNNAIYKVIEIENMTIRRNIDWDNDDRDALWINTSQQMLDYGIIPNCDTNYTDKDNKRGKSCTTPLGEFSVAFGNQYSRVTYGDFYITFLKHQYESCVAFFNSKSYEVLPDEWWARDSYDGPPQLQIKGDKSSIIFGRKPTLTIEETTTKCEVCKSSKYCTIAIHY